MPPNANGCAATTASTNISSRRWSGRVKYGQECGFTYAEGLRQHRGHGYPQDPLLQEAFKTLHSLSQAATRQRLKRNSSDVPVKSRPDAKPPPFFGQSERVGRSKLAAAKTAHSVDKILC